MPMHLPHDEPDAPRLAAPETGPNAEQALRETEERLRLAMTAAKGGTYVFDLAEKVLHVSPEAAAVYGLPPVTGTMAQADVLEFIIPEDRPGVLAALDEAAATGTYRVNYRVRCADGSLRPLASFAKYHPDNRRLVGFVMDVTDQRVAEEELRHSRTLLAEAEKLSHTGAWEWNLATDRWAFSDEWLRIHGCSKRTMTPDELLAIAHPDDRPAVARAFEEARRGLASYELEHRIVRQDDESVRCVRARGQFERDVYGRVEKVFGFVQDITESRRSEEALRASEARLKTVLENLPQGLILVEPNSGTLQWNRTALEMHGYESQEGITSLDHLTDIYEIRTLERALLAPEDWPVPRMLRGEELRDCELVVRDHRLRRERVFSYRAVMVPKDDGTPMMYVLTVVDVTQRKRAEAELHDVNARLAASDRRKDEFLAILSHELRNPLAPIRYALPLLEREPLAQPGVRALAVIQRQVDHLTRLVDDLLDVSRITRGKIELRPEVVPLAPILAAAVEASSPSVAAARHHLQVSVADEPIWVKADAARLAQVVTNLLNNSAKYTPRGGEISLTAGREDDRAVIRVRDTGMGIAEEGLPAVFEMFRQLGPSDTAQPGLGIGLALAKMLVELHGGTIEARSDGVGQGAEFVVRLPVAPDAAPSKVEDESGTRTGSRRLKVLVVDDNVDLVEMLATVVSSLGHDVRKALDGRSAVSAAGSYRPDVVLLDLGLPVMSGIEVARVLRQNRALQHTRLVALTGWGQAEDRRRTREAGFDFHLTKPTEPKTIEQLLAQLAA